jgi:hypothetical protein
MYTKIMMKKKCTNMTFFTFLAIAFLASIPPVVESGLQHNHKDVYENIENCPTGLSGNNCDIVYLLCPDDKRKCFNNSQCQLMDEPDEEEGFYYKCSCLFAESVSPTAGYECEHSATIQCDHGHFCVNGGTCKEFRGAYEHFHVGCECSEDFSGANCQYLKATMDGGLEGEGIEKEGYTYVNKGQLNLMYAFTIMFSMCCAGGLCYSLYSLVSYHRGNKAVIQLRTQMDKLTDPSKDHSVRVTGEIA